MTAHTIHVSEEVYHRLSEEATRLELTPEQVIERLLRSDTPQSTTSDAELNIPIPPAGSVETLAAVLRLSTLFGDIAIPNLDQVLADPLIGLANSEIADLES